MATHKTRDVLAGSNRKAFHDYFILETFEAGMVLLGTEVKSLRAGRVNLKEAFVSVDRGELYLYNCHISPYSHGNIANHEPTRRRKLLIKKNDILKLLAKTREKGLTLVPLKIYFKTGWAKIEVALAKGKKLHDKRDADAKKTANREIARGMRRKSYE